MIPSVLTSTKKILGIAEDYNAFDEDVLTHINAAFATLTQLGVGPEEGVLVEDETFLWSQYDVPNVQLNMVRTYVFLKVKSLFDPPPTSFAITAMNEQIAELEWRLNVLREVELYPDPLELVLIDEG